MSRTVAVIPARMGSTRFPGKPLARLCGMTMVEHVVRRTKLARRVDEVLVATCDAEIAEAVAAIGERVIMTAATHKRASDRVAEAARRVDAEIIVMVQGDEPLVRPESIDVAIEAMEGNASVVCVNLAGCIRSWAEFVDPNTIKTVAAENGDALYFSRSPIPHCSESGFDRITALKQVCVIPFRRDFLAVYSALPPTGAEEAEAIDMLRALGHGFPVRLVPIADVTQSVDTPLDLQHAEAMLQCDPVFARYKRN